MRRTLSKRALEREKRRSRSLTLEEVEEWVAPAQNRPRRRADCLGGARPCPFVGCRYNLYLDVRNDSIVFNAPGEEPWELEESCALDVADRGGVTLNQVGDLLGITSERIRQLEAMALKHLQEVLEGMDANPQTRSIPLSDNQVLEALGLKDESKWLIDLLSQSETIDSLPSKTSMTDSTWVTQ